MIYAILEDPRPRKIAPVQRMNPDMNRGEQRLNLEPVPAGGAHG